MNMICRNCCLTPILPISTECDCDRRATLQGVCSSETGECFCAPNLTPSCSECLPGFVHYPFCQG